LTFGIQIHTGLVQVKQGKTRDYLREEALIAGCRQKDRKAQKQLFDQYAPKFLGVCFRYVKNREDAEDVLIQGLYKVLNNIDKYSGMGSFEGWMRKVIVNEALMFLRKQKRIVFTQNIEDVTPPAVPQKVEHQMAADEILALLDQLPDGYRTVFNLYVIEGYKHREIAEMLGISINTSKSQLILAKKRLQQLLEKQGIRREN